MNQQKEKNLQSFFFPSSIAIIGASRDDKKIGHIILRNIIDSGFSGAIYPVNPQAKTIEGITCYTDYSDTPTTPDLAVIVIPASSVPEMVVSIAEKGTKNILILSAGFREAGSEGKRLEEAVIAAADVHNLNILGPNCLGFVNTRAHLNVTFGPTTHLIGNLRFLSQSGAIASSIFDWVKGTGLGLEQVITVGNKAVLGENDILSFWAEDHEEVLKSEDQVGMSRYRPIGMYLESIQDGKQLMVIAREIGKKDPIFLLKPGKSPAAEAAMRSHTGAMAGEDAVLEVALKHAGIIRCDGVEDLFDLSRAFAWENAPGGPRVGIVSNAGGPGVISTDALALAGLSLAPLSPTTKKLLAEKLPRAASVMNPIDVLGDALADRYAAAIEAVLQESTVDAVLIILTPQIMTDIRGTAEVIGRLSRQYAKPMFCSFMGDALIHSGEETLNTYRIPSFRFPERAVRAIGAMWQWRAWQEAEKKRKTSQTGSLLSPLVQGEIQTVIKKAREEERRTTLTNFESSRVLTLGGITTPPSISVDAVEQIDQFAAIHGFPLVLKMSSANILHKQDIGGVMTSLMDRAVTRQAFAEMKKRIAALVRRGQPSITIELQKQVEKGIEVIVGVKHDPQFGPALLIGAGGSNAELFQDTVIDIVPDSEEEILALIKKTKVFSLLSGYRGQEAFAIPALVDLIKKIIAIAVSTPMIKEIEINPVIVTADAAIAVDGKVVMRSN